MFLKDKGLFGIVDNMGRNALHHAILNNSVMAAEFLV